MRSDRLKKGDKVIHFKNQHRGEVTEINHKWGWFVVQYDNGHRYRYNFTDAHGASIGIDFDRM